MAPLRALLCSQNTHKLDELRAALPDWNLDLLALEDYPPEDGATYEANARLKAEHGRARAPREVWVLGEDSGIECDALGGGPGVLSARWAPPESQADALVARLDGEQNLRVEVRRYASSACCGVRSRPKSAAAGGSATTRCSCRGAGR